MKYSFNYKISFFPYASVFSVLIILKALDINIEDVGLNLEHVSVNDNPFYVKSVQILNSASEQELEFYYGLLRQGQKGINIFKS